MISHDFTNIISVKHIHFNGISITQIQNSTSEDGLKELLFDNSELLAEAGYTTKPINQVSLENKTHLIHALLVHYGLFIVKAEIDQFKEGLLKGMQLLIELQKHPELFAPVFTCVGEKPLTAGNEYYIVGHLLYLVCILEIILGLFTTKVFSNKGSSEYKKDNICWIIYIYAF